MFIRGGKGGSLKKKLIAGAAIGAGAYVGYKVSPHADADAECLMLMIIIIAMIIVMMKLMMGVI